MYNRQKDILRTIYDETTSKKDHAGVLKGLPVQ